MNEPAPQSGIQITTGFPPIAFALALATPRLQIDGGQPVMRPWGETFVPLAPGRHTLRCWFRYLFFSTAGDATVTVDLPPGQVVALRYQAPMWAAFASGTWQVGGTALPAAPAPAAVAAAASWHPDPSGRHEMRYWDGSAWTEHVSDQGVGGVDPM